jgi:FKBP-type peptidyl-prolyl cis-trans isomerase (trigger factor)
MNALRSRTLPELNDEFAKTQKVFPGLNTLDELKNELRTSLLKSAQEMAENELEIQLVGQIVRNSQVSFPDVMLRAEMEEAAQELQERLRRENATLEQYLEAVGKTREQVEQDMAQAADRRIRNSLALSEVAKAENIVADEADVEAELSERAEQAGVSAAAVRAFVEKNNQMEGMRSRALSRKVLGFLKAASQITDKVLTDAELQAMQNQDGGDGPPSDAPPAEAAAAEPLAVEQAVPKRRGKKAAAEDVED